MNDDGDALSVDELVEYCRTQAGLLSGRAETIGAETADLLDEIDEDIAVIRTDLAEHAGATEGPTASAPAGPNDAEGDLADLEEKQLIAEAKRARLAAFQDLAAAYIELAEEFESTVDGSEALDRLLRFERDHDAPTYFDDRRTLLEAATESDAPTE